MGSGALFLFAARNILAQQVQRPCVITGDGQHFICLQPMQRPDLAFLLEGATLLARGRLPELDRPAPIPRRQPASIRGKCGSC